jgi:hypothetical protein
MLSLSKGMGLGLKTPMVPLFALMAIECYHHFLSNGLPVAGET